MDPGLPVVPGISGRVRPPALAADEARDWWRRRAVCDAGSDAERGHAVTQEGERASRRGRGVAVRPCGVSSGARGKRKLHDERVLAHLRCHPATFLIPYFVKPNRCSAWKPRSLPSVSSMQRVVFILLQWMYLGAPGKIFVVRPQRVLITHHIFITSLGTQRPPGNLEMK